MSRMRAVLVLTSLCMALSGCERLASLENSKMRISGEWQRIEMSFPGDDVYDFSERVISINGIEEGAYRFESNSVVEVTLHGQLSVYEIEFVDDSNMVWYRKTTKGRDRASEWVKKKED